MCVFAHLCSILCVCALMFARVLVCMCACVRVCVAREQDKSSPLEVVTAQDPRFQNQVELAVRFGKTLFISEVDTVCGRCIAYVLALSL